MILKENAPVVLPKHAEITDMWVDGKGRLRGVILHQQPATVTLPVEDN